MLRKAPATPALADRGEVPVAEEAAISDRPPVAYVTALIAYVALGLVLKTAVLNWIVGPLFLVLTLHLVPAACRRLVARRGLGRR